MKKVYTNLTFTPLKRRWFRCNQTGERTKHCKAYANAHEKRTANNRSRQLTKVKMSLDQQWVCPECDRTNFYGVLHKEAICVCGKKVLIDTQSTGFKKNYFSSLS